MLNNVTLMGRLTHSPTLYTEPDKYSVCRFSIAVSRDYKGQDGEYATDFINIVAWNKLAKFAAEHFVKGQLIALTGSLRTRNYVDKEGKNRVATEVVAEHIYFASPKQENKPDNVSVPEPPSGLADSEEYGSLLEGLNGIPDDEPYPFE